MFMHDKKTHRSSPQGVRKRDLGKQRDQPLKYHSVLNKNLKDKIKIKIKIKGSERSPEVF